MRLGSLFDGIGGFPLAAQRNGMMPVWASEIEAVPMEITKKHFPNLSHLGDVTKIDGTQLGPVDVITFGSPCQDLSVAGKRAGLEGERSGLFMEAVRIIRGMRGVTFGAYPRFAVWENVPGAFSSKGGEDFRAVLEELTQAEIPMPISGRWANAGMVRTGGVDVAWRVLDAQYWGVPQRRKRIFLVADFGGTSAGEILFEPESVRRHFAAGSGAGQGTSGSAAAGVGEHDCIGEPITLALRGRGDSINLEHRQDGTANALLTPNGGRGGVGVGAVAVDCRNLCENEELSGTLQAKENGGHSLNYQNPVRVGYKVRRLTPTECERLQGYPDGWTEGHSDTARYKALGNSVAVPCVEFVMGGIARVLRGEKVWN